MHLFDHRAFAFTHMAVQDHTLVAGQGHGLLERLAVAVDRLTGRHRHLPHRQAGRIVKRINRPFTIADELIGGLQHRVRDRAAFGFWQGIPAPTCVKAHAQKLCRFELAVDDPRSGVLGKAVLVVKGRGASMFDQLGHGHDGTVIETVLGQPREDRIDTVQPFDHRIARPVQLCPVAHEALKEVVMRVDEARIDEMPGSVDDFGSSGACRDRSGPIAVIAPFSHRMS